MYEEYSYQFFMPIMLYNPAKIPAFSRECLKQNVSFHIVPHHALAIQQIYVGTNLVISSGFR
jgi:hypothetical protein